MYGKFLDLHEVHDAFCNLRGVEVGCIPCHMTCVYMCCVGIGLKCISAVAMVPPCSVWTTSLIFSPLIDSLIFPKRRSHWNTDGESLPTPPPIRPLTVCYVALRYLEKLLEYLCGYLDRVHPLLDQVWPPIAEVVVMS